MNTFGDIFQLIIDIILLVLAWAFWVRLHAALDAVLQCRDYLRKIAGEDPKPKPLHPANVSPSGIVYKPPKP